MAASNGSAIPKATRCRRGRRGIESSRLTATGDMRILPPFARRGPSGYRRVPPADQEPIMAKSNTVQIKLISTADTGFFYVTKKNARTTTTKLELKKYDPVVRKHVAFKESKIK